MSYFKTGKLYWNRKHNMPTFSNHHAGPAALAYPAFILAKVKFGFAL
jgi:hypothetical protein